MSFAFFPAKSPIYLTALNSQTTQNHLYDLKQNPSRMAVCMYVLGVVCYCTRTNANATAIRQEQFWNTYKRYKRNSKERRIFFAECCFCHMVVAESGCAWWCSTKCKKPLLIWPLAEVQLHCATCLKSGEDTSNMKQLCLNCLSSLPDKEFQYLFLSIIFIL